jgi:glycosyltransferase involved in cell wall biosynthesis
LNEPLVSIIVPLYNHEQYIEATLNSFVSEGYRNLEIVVIDDGSQDNSFTVAKQWFEVNQKVFSNVILQRQNNVGITKTLNRLINLSSGEFITMVASDDLLNPGGIQVRLNELTNRPDWLAVFGDATVIDEKGYQLASSALQKIGKANLNALKRDDLRARELILRWSVPGPVLLSRRKAFDPNLGVGLYDETMFIEDRNLYLKLLARNALGFVNKPVASYRLHQKNTISAAKSLARVYRAMFDAESKHTDAFKNLDRLALKLMSYHSSQNLKRVEGSGYQKINPIIQLLGLEFARRLWCIVENIRISG